MARSHAKKHQRRRAINATRERTFHVSERREDATTYPTWRRERVVPAIRLSGEWLKQLGFTSGAKVTVTPDERRLVLTIAE
jgi:hypothetical protein